MLNRFELLFGILSSWITSIILIIIVKKRGKDKLPKGSIVIEGLDLKDNKELPANKWSRRGVYCGVGINTLIIISVIILCIIDWWTPISAIIALDLPIWINWIGIAGIWIQDMWGVSIFAYNVNYTSLTRPMKGKYVLATGGPYNIIRHPMYVGKMVLTFFIFMATGIWLTFFSFIGLIALPSQAKGEEEALKKIFGEKYKEYASKTGRFFPKLKRK